MWWSLCYGWCFSPHPDGHDAVDSAVSLHAGERGSFGWQVRTLAELGVRLEAPSHLVCGGREGGGCKRRRVSNKSGHIKRSVKLNKKSLYRSIRTEPRRGGYSCWTAGISRSAEQRVREAALAFIASPSDCAGQKKKKKVCSGFLMCACVCRACACVLFVCRYTRLQRSRDIPTCPHPGNSQALLWSHCSVHPEEQKKVHDGTMHLKIHSTSIQVLKMSVSHLLCLIFKCFFPHISALSLQYMVCSSALSCFPCFCFFTCSLRTNKVTHWLIDWFRCSSGWIDFWSQRTNTQGSLLKWISAVNQSLKYCILM